MVDAILLELHAAKDVNIRDVGVQRRKRKPQLALSDRLFVLAAKDKRLFNELTRAAAPARPEAKLKKPYGKHMGGNHPEDPDERLLAADFCTHILTKYGGLEIRGNPSFGHVQ